MSDSTPTTESWATAFDGVAASYDQSGVPFFGPIAEELVRRLAPAPGERVLDLGSGRGAATLPLAEAVGPSGSVTALDVSGRMVELLAATVAERGIANAVVFRGDAATPPAGRFDVVCASLVLFFLPDPVAALSAWRGALTPRGRVGISSFGAPLPTLVAVWEVLQSYTAPDGDDPDPPGPFDSDDGVEGLFAEAGFSSATTDHVTLAVPFHDVQQWLAWMSGTPQRALWNLVPEARHADALSRVDAVLRRADYRIDIDVRYTLARP